MSLVYAAVEFDWAVFWKYVWPPTALENPLIRDGLIATVFMAVTAEVLGVVIGVIAGIGQSSRVAPLRWIFKAYILYFRGTPLTIQLALIYFGSAALGLYTFPDVHIVGINLQGIIQAGVLGLALNEGAYMAEIVRAGVLGVEAGQWEAAKAIGMRNLQTLRFIVMPQAARIIVPPLGNQFNQMLKSTTLVVIIGGAELFNAFQQVNAVIFKPFELFFAASFYFLALTAIWTVIQSWMERRLDPAGRAAARAAGSTGFFTRVFSGQR